MTTGLRDRFPASYCITGHQQLGSEIKGQRNASVKFQFNVAMTVACMVRMDLSIKYMFTTNSAITGI